MYENDVDYVLPVNKDEKKNNKFSKKWIVIIIVAALAVVTISVIAVSFFIPKSIEGEWELVVNPEIAQATPDEIPDSERVYYTFTSPGEYGDGKYTTYYNGGVEEGTYKLSQKDGKDMINLGTQDLEYYVSGSKLLGNASLVIIFPEQTNQTTRKKTPASEYIFYQEDAPDYYEMSYAEYNTDEKLINEWISNDRTLSYFQYTIPYTETIEFSDDGIMTINYESKIYSLTEQCIIHIQQRVTNLLSAL